MTQRETHIIQPRNFRILAEGLQFPEGPIAMDDGSTLLVEVAAGKLTRIGADGSATLVADCGGGPNGAAIGADGAVYVANNGGAISFKARNGRPLPGHTESPEWPGHGSIQRVELSTGAVTTLYDECNGQPLRGPNDLVVDADGSIWFTDHGAQHARSIDRGGVYWCQPDGTEIREVVYPLDRPNGIGLSANGARLFVSETYSGRVWSWDVEGPGVLQGSRQPASLGSATLVADPGGFALYDSLAVDGEGWVCVARLGDGGIQAIAAEGEAAGLELVPMPDNYTTNISFGSDGTAYVTLSGSGRLAAFEWHRRPGILAFTG